MRGGLGSPGETNHEVIKMLTSFYLASATFQPATHLAPELVAGPIRSVAMSCYDTTQFSNDLFEGGLHLDSAQIRFDNEPWHQKTFFTNRNGRISLNGSVYSSSQRNIMIIGFHGSHWIEDWIANLSFKLAPADIHGLTGHVHSGFSKIVDANFNGMRNAIQYAVNQQGLSNPEIIFTGHSLGGPLAILSMMHFLANDRNHTYTLHQIKAVTFSAPLIGDEQFVNYVYRHLTIDRNILQFYCSLDLAVHSLRILNITGYNEKDYKDIGIRIEIPGTEQWVTKIQKSIEYVCSENIDKVAKVVVDRFGGVTINVTGLVLQIIFLPTPAGIVIASLTTAGAVLLNKSLFCTTKYLQKK